MGDTPLATLFASRNTVKRAKPTDGQMVPSPSVAPLTSEESLGSLLGPGERPIVIFPITPPEIQAILPKAGPAQEGNPNDGENL